MRSKRSKMVVLAVLTGLLAGLLVMPASANKVDDKDPAEGNVKDTGIILDGLAKMGKNRTFCTHEGDSDVFGPGLGLPTQATKNGYWQITGTVTSLVNQHVGLLKACGRLDKMNSNVNGGIGAACGASKGWDGKGTIHFPDKRVTIWLKDLGWKVSAASKLSVTGRAVQAQNETEAKDKLPNSDDHVVADFNVRGEGCASKGDPTDPVNPQEKNGDNPGATEFAVNGIYELIQGPVPDRNVGPTCKSGGTTCLYRTKKPGKNG